MLRTLNLGSGLVFLALLATFATAQQTRVQVDTGVPLPDFQPDAAYLLSTLHIDHLDAGTPENPVDTCMIREGCLAGYGNRTVVRFGTMIWNRGPGDAFLGNHPDDCSPENPPYFEFDYCHGHWHFRAYASYSLWKGNVTVAVGHKMGFCMEDSVCPPDRTPKFNCDIQGISAGCADLYYATLACQWIDVTDLVSLPSFDRDQELELRVTVNHDGKFPETNIGNNEAKVKFRMSGLQEFSSNVWRQPRHGEVPEACEKARPNAAAKV